MALAPDERAWEVSYKKVEDMWYAEFMFVDLEYDGFMVKMFLDGCGGYELRFDTNGCEYFMMADGELSLHQEWFTHSASQTYRAYGSGMRCREQPVSIGLRLIT